MAVPPVARRRQLPRSRGDECLPVQLDADALVDPALALVPDDPDRAVLSTRRRDITEGWRKSRWPQPPQRSENTPAGPAHFAGTRTETTSAVAVGSPAWSSTVTSTVVRRSPRSVTRPTNLTGPFSGVGAE